MRSAFACMLLIAVACLAGCTGGPTIPSSAAPMGATGATPYDGTWEGTTVDGLAVSVSVKENQIRSFSIELSETAGSACVFGSGGVEIFGSANFDLVARPYPIIAADRFTIVSNAPIYAQFPNAATILGSTSFTMTGAFAGSAADGTTAFQFSAGNPSTCGAQRSLAWNLERK